MIMRAMTLRQAIVLLSAEQNSEEGDQAFICKRQHAQILQGYLMMTGLHTAVKDEQEEKHLKRVQKRLDDAANPIARKRKGKRRFNDSLDLPLLDIHLIVASKDFYCKKVYSRCSRDL